VGLFMRLPLYLCGEELVIARRRERLLTDGGQSGCSARSKGATVGVGSSSRSRQKRTPAGVVSFSRSSLFDGRSAPGTVQSSGAVPESDKGADGGAFVWLLLAQGGQQRFIGGRPLLAPLTQRLRMLKAPGRSASSAR
jgi:hypothetical protein